MNDKILEHINLIYKVMNDLHCKTDEETQDEMFFEGLIGLDRAMKTYKEGSTKRLTYYYICIRNAITTKFNYNTRTKRDIINTISLETPIFDDIVIADMVKDNTNLDADLIKKEQLECIYKVLEEMKDTQYKKYICDYYGINCEPLKSTQLAKKYGVSHQNISQSINQGLKILKKKVKKEYEKENKKNNSKIKNKMEK